MILLSPSGMSFFKEIPPTAGFALRWYELFQRGRYCNGKSLEEDFRGLLGAPFARITSSGTAALYLILQGLKKVSSRRTVVVPSFVCPLLPLAVRRAGMKVEICDIRRDRFDFDLANLKDICLTNPDVLAIIAVHLAGIPLDLDPIRTIAGENNVLIIEDCAQSLGALHKDRSVGTVGDVSFFSLCRGKGVTTYEGGAIVAASEKYSAHIDVAMKEHAVTDVISEASLLMLLFGYWIFYRPSLFWFVFKLPQIYWTWRGNQVKAAAEDFRLDFPVQKMSAVRQGIGHRQFPRLGEEIRQQRSKAEFYFRGLQGVKGISVVKELPGTSSTYPSIVLVFNDDDVRNRALKALERIGTGASILYAMAVCDYGYLNGIVNPGNCDNGRFMAGHCITLSTSSFIGKHDMETTLSVLRDVLRQ